ncbi:MAG: hypothetical protein QXW45_06785 [Thermosphaera sp.]
MSQKETTDQADQQVQLPIIERYPHPSLMDYDVIAITSKVRHEFLVPKDTATSDFIDDLMVYVLDYEDAYPDLQDPDLWTWIVDNYVDKAGQTKATTP